MRRPRSRSSPTASLVPLCSAIWLCVALPAAAQAPEIESLRSELARQAAQLEEQQQMLDEQRAMLQRQQELLEERARGPSVAQGPIADPVLIESPATLTSVRGGQSQAPPPSGATRALPEFASVLTPRGALVLEPSLELVHGSSNRLVFRGIEIVTGLQIGVIEASDADRNAAIATASARYGLSDRLELELRVPYVYRDDRVTTLAQRDEAITRSISLDGSGLGDVEASARYQFNNADGGGPIYIGNLRFKSDTGTNPWEIGRDEFGILLELPTGSGFWAVEPGVTILYPSDPVVLFATASYLYHAPETINRVVGDVLIGEVDPGDSIGASAGFGFALNPRFSFSLGYKHNYIMETDAEFGPTTQTSESLHVGSLLLGMSYAFNARASANLSFEFGVTSDAPDVRVILRTPFTFGAR